MPNLLTPDDEVPQPEPVLMLAFRRHFHGMLEAGGTEAEFHAEWIKFRDEFISASVDYCTRKHGYKTTELNRQCIANGARIQVDNLYALILGMGQLAVLCNLIPIPTPTETPREVHRGTSEASESPKAKPKEARRFTHVLSNIIAKNFRVEGPHGIPQEAQRHVPSADRMIAEMIAAMEDGSQALDYPETKPYKDHWKNMHEPEFRRLAETLFYHLNELHQGVDYVEGFRYSDRYHNLIGLLKSCKGTIYFMSRPSTYEDVILNPHMMKLRFADNQKNNAKKKDDNKELIKLRHQQYVELNGCDPPPKERVVKGKKRTASTMNDNEAENSPTSSVRPATKRRKAPSRKAKTAAAAATITAASPSEVSFDVGEGSSFQRTFDTPEDSPSFSNRSNLGGLEAFVGAQQPNFYITDEQGPSHLQEHPQQQLYSSQQQRQLLPAPQYQQQQYFNPRLALLQHQRSTSRRSNPQGQQKSTKTLENRNHAAASLDSGSIDCFRDIDFEVSTTLSEAIGNNNYTADTIQDLAPLPSFDESSPIDNQLQQQAIVQNNMSIPHKTVLPVHEQLANKFHQYNELESGYFPNWTPQSFNQSRATSLVRQEFEIQSPETQPEPQKLLSTADQPEPEPAFEANSWIGVMTPEGDIDFDFLDIMPPLPSRLDDAAMARGDEIIAELDRNIIAQQGTVSPQEIFGHQQDFLDMQNRGLLTTNYFNGVDTNAPGFGDLNLEFNENIFLYSPPLVAASPTNSGGQVFYLHGGQNKNKEMGEMLEADP